MITPIGFFLQVLEFIEHTNRRSTLYDSAKVGYGYFWRYHRHNVDMVRLNTHLLNLYLLLCAKGSNAVANFITHGSFQYPMAVLWDPDDVVLAVPNGM